MIKKLAKSIKFQNLKNLQKYTVCKIYKICKIYSIYKIYQICKIYAFESHVYLGVTLVVAANNTHDWKPTHTKPQMTCFASWVRNFVRWKCCCHFGLLFFTGCNNWLKTIVIFVIIINITSASASVNWSPSLFCVKHITLFHSVKLVSEMHTQLRCTLKKSSCNL